jgi:hypothetical protein
VTNDPDRSYFEWSRELETADDVDLDVVKAILVMLENQTDSMRDHFASPQKWSAGERGDGHRAPEA